MKTEGCQEAGHSGEQDHPFSPQRADQSQEQETTDSAADQIRTVDTVCMIGMS